MKTIANTAIIILIISFFTFFGALFFGIWTGFSEIVVKIGSTSITAFAFSWILTMILTDSKLKPKSK